MIKVSDCEDVSAEIRRIMKTTKTSATYISMHTGLDKGFLSRTINENLDFRVSTINKILRSMGYCLYIGKSK